MEKCRISSAKDIYDAILHILKRWFSEQCVSPYSSSVEYIANCSVHLHEVRDVDHPSLLVIGQLLLQPTRVGVKVQ